MTSNSPVRWPTLTIRASAASFSMWTIRLANSAGSAASASATPASAMRRACGRAWCTAGCGERPLHPPLHGVGEVRPQPGGGDDGVDRAHTAGPLDAVHAVELVG